jgi:hypothetical protein
MSIGSRKQNSQLIVNALERFEETGRAAQSCVELNFGGFKDWFLPSQSELNLMYQNLKAKRIGGFGDNWSSSEDGRVSWAQNFKDGIQSNYWNGDGNKTAAHSVRAVESQNV